MAALQPILGGVIESDSKRLSSAGSQFDEIVPARKAKRCAISAFFKKIPLRPAFRHDQPRELRRAN